MDRDLAYDYLLRSGMDAAQADLLSRILADMEARLATKADLAALQSELRADFAGLRAELTQELGGLRAEWKEVFGES
jgi:hypothetical protein